MIDLHLHFDGSISPAIARRLMAIGGDERELSDDELRSMLCAGSTCRDLNEYLARFDFPLSLLQTPEQVRACVSLLCAELAELGLDYAELRFAPQSLCTKGFSQQEIVEAAIDGLVAGCGAGGELGEGSGAGCGAGGKLGEGSGAGCGAGGEGSGAGCGAGGEGSGGGGAGDGASGFEAQLILCCMRGDTNEAANLETVSLTRRYLGRGVCALDLAGAEALFSTSSFAHVFARARELDVPFTIHAGEAAGPRSIWDALAFGASRIGHGVRAVEDPTLVEELARREIPLEICPTSNLNTCVYARYEDIPLRALLDAEVRVTINSDNMAVSDTNVIRELEIVRDTFGLSDGEMAVLQRNADRARFAQA